MLGRALGRALQDKHEIWGLDLTSAQTSMLSAAKRGGSTKDFGGSAQNFIECDITDKDGLVSAIGKAKPDIVIHTAAYTDVDGCELGPDKAYKINGEGTENIALACKKHDALLIYISTDFVFDGTKIGAYNEEDAPNPINTYGRSKLMGEEAIRKNVKRYYIIRTSWLFGEGGRNFVNTIIEKARVEKRIKIVSNQFGCPTYAIDLAQAIERLISHIERVSFGTYHVSSGSACSWYELAKEIISLLKLNEVTIEPISADEYKTPTTRPHNSVLNITKFASAAGTKMRGHKEALEAYLNKIKTGHVNVKR